MLLVVMGIFFSLVPINELIIKFYLKKSSKITHELNFLHEMFNASIKLF